jgi:hypothetical protein
LQNSLDVFILFSPLTSPLWDLFSSHKKKTPQGVNTPQGVLYNNQLRVGLYPKSTI